MCVCCVVRACGWVRVSRVCVLWVGHPGIPRRAVLRAQPILACAREGPPAPRPNPPSSQRVLCAPNA